VHAAALAELTAAGFVSMLAAHHGMQKFLSAYSDVPLAASRHSVRLPGPATVSTNLGLLERVDASEPATP
jgi:hypothetical protein